MSEPKRMTVTWKDLGGGETGKTEWVSLAEYKLLEAEVERLTKAGDNLVYVVSEHPVSEPFVKAWFAAKGVQS
jgi:hypothetical protein